MVRLAASCPAPAYGPPRRQQPVPCIQRLPDPCRCLHPAPAGEAFGYLKGGCSPAQAQLLHPFGDDYGTLGGGSEWAGAGDAGAVRAPQVRRRGPGAGCFTRAAAQAPTGCPCKLRIAHPCRPLGPPLPTGAAGAAAVAGARGGGARVVQHPAALGVPTAVGHRGAGAHLCDDGGGPAGDWCGGRGGRACSGDGVLCGGGCAGGPSGRAGCGCWP